MGEDLEPEDGGEPAVEPLGVQRLRERAAPQDHGGRADRRGQPAEAETRAAPTVTGAGPGGTPRPQWGCVASR
jgi:hypothetical protein